jgi:pimeloyl-ACP methyl ester carboxylesterase
MIVETILAVGATAVTGIVAERIASARERQRLPMPGRLVTVGGTTLHAVVRGKRLSPRAPAIILDGGLTVGSLAWPGVVEALGPSWLSVTVDRAGHNWSGPARGRRDAAAAIADQRALLEALGVAPPWLLVAHSYAGNIARLHAQRYASDIVGLVFVETTPAPLAADVMRSGFARAFAWKVPLARLGLWRAWRAVSRRAPIPSAVTPATMIAAWARLSQSAKDLAATKAELATFTDMAAEADAAPPPRQPAIVLASSRGAVAIPPGMTEAAAHDRALAAQRVLAERLNLVALRVTDASDHEIPWNAPRLVAAAVAEVAARSMEGDGKA